MKSARRRSAIAVILEALASEQGARLQAEGADFYRLEGSERDGLRIPASAVGSLASAGLLLRPADGQGFAADPALGAWLRRRSGGADPFLSQHVRLSEPLGGSAAPRINLDVSPIAALARPGRGGAPFLEPAAITAAERLRRDFEFARLQPRITASWSASVNTGRRDGSARDLADNVIAARKRVEKAIMAVGPELSGVLLDVCCFLKGIEAVERERRWPARSAKLVLRLALAALARHYGIGTNAEGAERAEMRHWGASDYRPAIG
jgi:hypothetical protein